MLHKLLIANRGEIAIRVMRTCKEMGITTVAVYSDADKDALFVKQADEAIALGGYQSADTYLAQDKIIDAAKRSGADAIHPGYGFLSENASFAKRCKDEGIIFVGPSADAIESMGDKKTAKQIVAKNNVPTIPGYDGEDQSLKALSTAAKEIGFPVLLKASAGGGGKGMRIVRKEKDLQKLIDAAKREALNAFDNDILLIEKYFDNARHVEFQVFGDEQGNVIHLFERECSIQRRYQKIIEESPSPALNDALRTKMAEAAVNAAKAVNYTNAGTVEFILVPDGEFYFLEMNTRLQVEHPVTEFVTGLDLVKMQLEVAQGNALPYKQADIKQNGHAIECRVYAEDAYNNFLPATGTVHLFEPYNAPYARFDSGVESGSVIDIYYDPMIGKVITYGSDRNDAIRKMIDTLNRTVLLGTITNKHFLTTILQHKAFVSGDFDTHFLETYNELTKQDKISEGEIHYSLIAAQLYNWEQRNSNRKLLKGLSPGWRNNFYQPQFQVYTNGDNVYTLYYAYKNGAFSFIIGEHKYTANIINTDANQITCTINGYRATYAITTVDEYVYIQGKRAINLKIVPRFPDNTGDAEAGGYIAPMPGEVLKVMVKPGDTVKAGDGLLVLLSMKMENTIEAFEDGEIEELFIKENGFVEADTLLLKMKEVK